MSMLNDLQGQHVTKPIVIASISSVLGSSFHNGFNTGALNQPLQNIMTWVNSVYYNRTGSIVAPCNDDKCSHPLFSFIVAAFLLGAMPGALCAGYVVGKIGCKKSLMINLIFNYVGAILMACSMAAASPEMLIIGRLIVGFQCGFGMVVCPMYLTESCTLEVRGSMGTLYQLTVTIGILTSQILGLEKALGGDTTWPWLLAFNAVPATIAIVLLPLCPENPKYLLYKGLEEDAKKELKKFRGPKATALSLGGQLAAMKEEIAHTADSENTYKMMLKLMASPVRHLRIGLLIAIVLNLAQQITGINAVFFYSSIIYEDAGFGEDVAPYITIATGIINVLATIVAVFLVEKSGRKVLLLFGMMAMAAATIVITITLTIQDNMRAEITQSTVSSAGELNVTLSTHATTTIPTNGQNFTTSSTTEYSTVQQLEPSPGMEACAYISMLCVWVFVIGFAVGLGCIPQFIGSELFRDDYKPAAMSLACMANWLGNFLVALLFPLIQHGLKSYTFLVFLVILVCVICFTQVLVPETRQKQVGELERTLSRGRLVSGGCGRRGDGGPKYSDPDEMNGEVVVPLNTLEPTTPRAQ